MMKNFMKGIITFVFALMFMLPISVFAATEITNADLEAARGGDTSKGITYYEGDFASYRFAEGEYVIGEDIDLEYSLFTVNDDNVTFDLNGKTLSALGYDFGVISIFGESNVTIKGNGTIDSPAALLVANGAKLNVNDGTYSGEVYTYGYAEDDEITYSHLNIKNGTFKKALHLEYADAVIDDGTFDATEANQDAIYVNSGSSIEINGGTFKSVWNGLMAEPSADYDFQNEVEIKGSNVKSVVINGGTFVGADETGLSAFEIDNLEINGGTFTGGMAGFGFDGVEKIVVKGGTFKANGEDTVGAIVTYGENTELLTAILGEGCEFNPAIEAQVIDKWNNKLVVSQNEITVINKSVNDYTYLEGENLEYDSEKDDVATFRINTEYKFFKDGGKVYVDDELVDSSNYTSESGSTIIKFTKEFMTSLSSGEHTLKVVFNNDKSATTKFTVKNASTANPKTIDNISSHICVLFIGIFALITTLYLIKKSENR